MNLHLQMIANFGRGFAKSRFRLSDLRRQNQFFDWVGFLCLLSTITLLVLPICLISHCCEDGGFDDCADDAECNCFCVVSTLQATEYDIRVFQILLPDEPIRPLDRLTQTDQNPPERPPIFA